MNTKVLIMERFSNALRLCLIDKFNRIPTAQKFSDEFNLRSIDPITRETARKWINGLVMPKPERILVLIKWLNLNSDYVYLNSAEIDNQNLPINNMQRLRKIERFAHNALNFATPRIAIMDKLSNIIMVNTSWRSAAVSNPPIHRDAVLCEGANYLNLLDKVKGEGEKDAKKMASNIRELLRNPSRKFKLKYPCHSPYSYHWFLAELSSYKEKEDLCLIISHQEISELQFIAKI